MAMLDTVADYVRETRTLLQDLIAPYRYTDLELLSTLNMALLQARKLRADLFLGVTTVPSYSAVDATAVAMDQQYRTSIVYFMTGHAQLRDEEDTQDSRAAGLISKFTAQLTTVGG